MSYSELKGDRHILKRKFHPRVPRHYSRDRDDQHKPHYMISCTWQHCTSYSFVIWENAAYPINIINVAEVIQRCWLEESGQWLDNVDRTHLVLASGKPVLQKKFASYGNSQSVNLRYGWQSQHRGLADWQRGFKKLTCSFSMRWSSREPGYLLLEASSSNSCIIDQRLVLKLSPSWPETWNSEGLLFFNH